MDVYDSLINDDGESIYKGNPNKEGYQGPPYSPEIDEIIYNGDEEMAANSYDQYIGAEVLLPDWKGEKLIGEVRKHVIYDDTSTDEGNYNAMHDKSLYEVEYPGGTTEQLEANIIAENMMSQVESEGHHYQVLTEVTDKKNDDSFIAKMDGFINSSIGNLHWKRTTCGWKLLLEWKDGSVDWVTLKNLKHFNPVDLAKYSVEN